MISIKEKIFLWETKPVISGIFIIFAFFCVLPISVTSLRCGVCSSGGTGGGLAALRSQFPSLQGKVPTCGPGSGEMEQPLALECPREYQAGCLTQSKGKQVAKMCSNIPVQDCKSANGVEYCYCRGELCNIGGVAPPPAPPTLAPRPPIPTPPTPTPTPRYPDDEDDDTLTEGSGGGRIKPKPPINSPPSSTPKSTVTKAPTKSSSSKTTFSNSLTILSYFVIIHISKVILAQF